MSKFIAIIDKSKLGQDKPSRRGLLTDENIDLS